MTDPTYERNLKCAFESVHLEFSTHINTARSKLSQESLDEYYDGVEFFATIGQGDSISIAFANVMPWVGAHFGRIQFKKLLIFLMKPLLEAQIKSFWLIFYLV